MLLRGFDAALRAGLRAAATFFAGLRFAVVRLAVVRFAAVFLPPRRAAARDGARLFEERLADDFFLELFFDDLRVAAIRFLLC